MRRLNSAALATLRFFEAAARLQSFTRAASELCITQGAVSHQVKYLEDFLGCKLFFRLPRQVKLTEEGEKFVAVVTCALRALDQGAESIISPNKARINVRLRTGPSFALRWLVPRLGEFYERYPNIKLHVIGAYGYFDPVHRDFDLAVEFIQGVLPALHTEVLMEEYLTPVCTPEYLSCHNFLKTPKDLARCTLLHDGDAWENAAEDAEWRCWLSEVGALDIDSNQGQFFSLANMALEAALSNQGIAMGRLSLIQELLENGRLIIPFKPQVRCPTSYCLVYPSELASRPGVREVIEWLREQADRAHTSNLDRRSKRHNGPAVANMRANHQ